MILLLLFPIKTLGLRREKPQSTGFCDQVLLQAACSATETR